MPDIFDDDAMGQDMAATAATISDNGSSPASSPTDAVPSGAASPPAVPAGAAPSPAEWDALPKSWKKEMEAHWKAFNPDARKYIHEREKQALDGIMQYKTVADQWNETLKPFGNAFQQYGIDPRQAFGTILNNHFMLKYGQPEQRAAIAKRMIEDYGLGQFMQQGGPAMDPRLLARLDSLETAFRGREEAAARADVDAFFSNPQNEFAKEVAADMNQLLETGAATDLKSAYEKAIWLNPAVRAKLMEREALKIAGTPKPHLREVRSSDTPPAPTGGASESIDDTMRGIVANMTK